MIDGLPKGWDEIALPEIASLNMGQSPSSDTYNFEHKGLPFFQGKTEFGALYPTPTKFCSAPIKIAEANDILISVRAPVGPTNICRERSCIGRGLAAIRPRGDIPTLYLLFHFRNIEAWLSKQGTGSTFTAISKLDLEQIMVPLAPLAEQRRIVAKLEKLLGHVEACKRRLDKLPKLLKRYRQSVLAAACSGRLTADWRGENPTRETAESIVETIRQRREAEAKTDAQKKKLREIFSVLEENDSSELADNWRFVALNKLGSFNYGTSAKSQPCGKTPVLRMGNIQDGKVDWSDLVYTSNANEIENYSLKPNTVLFNRTNSPELVGKTAIYRGERPAIFAGYLIRINPFPELNPEYLNFCLNTNYAKEFCLRVKTDGVSQSNINAQKLGAFELPLCPLAEQQEIVRRVEGLFKLADHLEQRLAQARKQVDTLEPSLLARAFAGRLVPQDANDESASALLQRIRKQREGPTDDNMVAVDFTKPPSQSQFDMGLPPLPEGDIIEFRAALDTYVLSQLPFDKQLGRTKMEKVSHFLEFDCGIDLRRDTKRNVAGPVDFPSRLNVEEKARALKWFTTVEHKAPGGKTRIEYIREKRFGEAIPIAEKFMGDRKPAVDRIIKLLKPLTTDECSILATLYAAWNDLLLLRRPVSDEAIITESTVNWHPEKQKISSRDWNWGLDWLRRNNLIPRGRGKPIGKRPKSR